MGLLLVSVFGALAWQRPLTKYTGELNSHAVVAVFDGVVIDDRDRLRAYYVLINHTDIDYRFERNSQVSFVMKIRNRNGDFRELSEREFRLSSPLSVRAGQRELLMVTDLRRTYSFERPRLHASRRDSRLYRKKLGAFLRSQWPDFDGFAILDGVSGYEIDLPRGW